MPPKGGVKGRKLGPHTAKKLAAVELGRMKEPGMHPDGKGLYFRIGPTGSKSWIFRFRAGGKRHGMGLGAYPDVSLADARKKAEECRRMRASGVNPLHARNSDLASRRAAEEARRIAEARKITFKDCAWEYIASHGRAWKSVPHAHQWPSSLEAYVYPIFGDLPVEAIDTALVLKALRPIWTEKSVTASRVRGRIESVLDWAKAQELREDDNPARWRGHLDNLLPKQKGRPKHHAALPYADLPAFMAWLWGKESNVARALEFTILTAVRPGETLGARWEEVDLRQKLWTIPAARMKAGTDHRVPLSGLALVILEGMAEIQQSAFVFPGTISGKPFSRMAMLMLLREAGHAKITVHGFRSTFRDWAAEQTSFSREVCEAALAHTLENKVEAAYFRSDLLDKRRQLMEAWADFAYRLQGGNIIELKTKKSEPAMAV